MNATNLAQAIDAVELDIERLTAEGKLDVAHFLARLLALTRGLRGRPVLKASTGRVVSADLGADGPPFILGVEEPGSPLRPGETLLAEYLIDTPQDDDLDVYTRLEGPLDLVPVTRDEAAAFTAAHHRRHPRRPAGWRFGVGVARQGALVGVAWAGNPTARLLADGFTLELQRVTVRISRNAATRLIGAIARAAAALGFRRLITYTGLDEEAASIKAAGFTRDAVTRGGEADRPSRSRNPVEDASEKQRWTLDLITR